MNKIYTVESLVNTMREYTESFQKMSPEDAKVKAITALQSSRILNESGNINQQIFKANVYVKNE